MNYTKVWEDLALLLATGKSQTEAARIVGITDRTVRKRWANATFRARVVALRSEIIGQAVGLLASNMAQSVDVLQRLLAEDVRATVRLGAARANLELGCKLHESTDLEARLSALEERLPITGRCEPPSPPSPTEEEDGESQPAD